CHVVAVFVSPRPWRALACLLLETGRSSVPMIRPMAFTFALVLAMACAGQASAQVFFRMDFSPGAQPDAGWNATDPGATHSRTFIAGGGPNGENVYELTQRHTGSSSSHYGGEYYWGWTGNIEAQNPDRKGTRLNSSHVKISYAVFCLKKKIYKQLLT